MSLLPSHMCFIQRGWLSANHLLLLGSSETVLVDSGYVSHSEQTLGLVSHALKGRVLDRLINTHLHSDHCGGNAALQQRYPSMQTTIAPGLAHAVHEWDEQQLTYLATGQDCPRFAFQDILSTETEIDLAGDRWQVHAAPGHDPHSVILYQADHGVLISADALWENGFGVVFPEIVGEDGFSGIAHTLNLIEQLAPRVVVPGHGPMFSDVTAALSKARQRLSAFEANPAKHAIHAAKVLLKFKLLDWQHISDAELLSWCQQCSHLLDLHRTHFSQQDLPAWVHHCMEDLVKAAAARRDGMYWLNV